MSKNHSEERCIKDDRELHQWVEWAKEWQRQRGITEPPYDPERIFQIAAEVKARLNSKPAETPVVSKKARKSTSQATGRRKKSKPAGVVR
jgi:hypothetical protein